MKELSFSYLSPREIESAEQMLMLGTHALKVISDHYVAISVIGAPGKHDCPIHEILYSDIEKYGTMEVKSSYQGFVEKYGQETCDLIFPKDESFIKDKIARTISFVMDKVYNCDKLMIIIHGDTINSRFDRSSIPNLIHASIQENFNVIELPDPPKMRYLITMTK
ncbi:MAG: hypothetical protein NC548_39240 [Lachnospiraceae bacterium]|nr:hypothetical protein [Lachnospiraceae bacterium]